MKKRMHSRKWGVIAAVGLVVIGILSLGLYHWFPEEVETQRGVASWYGPNFHGKRTASGEIFDQHEMTAASRTLPLGTRVTVTNLANGKKAKVTINDRGPYADGRIIDLSKAAARKLGLLDPGTARVRIEVIGDEIESE